MLLLLFIKFNVVDLTQNFTSGNTKSLYPYSCSYFQWYSHLHYCRIHSSPCHRSSQPTSCGTLYNYCAALANTICESRNLSDAAYDICPKGWRLPTGGDSGEFKALYDNYNTSYKMRASVSSGGAAFALAGNFGSTSPGSQGSGGYYLSSARYNNTRTYTLSLTFSTVDSAFDSDRAGGYSVRCIFK